MTSTTLANTPDDAPNGRMSGSHAGQPAQPVAGQLKGRRIALLVHFDSYLPLAGAVAEAMIRAKAECDLFTLDRSGMTLSDAQLAGGAQIWPVLSRDVKGRLTVDQLGEDAFLDQYDAVLLGCGGPAVKAALRAIQKARPWPRARPVTITGFPGVLDLYRTIGMLSRAASDIVLLPAPAQMRAYRTEMRLMMRSPRNGVLFGVASLPGAVRSPLRQGAKRSVVYVDQPIVPKSLSERRALVHLLADWLGANPDAHLYVRERTRPEETSIHVGEAPTGSRLGDMIPVIQKTRPELARAHMSDTPLKQLYETCDGAIGICSAGLMESVVTGVPTVSLLDFSHRPRYGSHFFGQSGLRRRMADLITLGWPEPDQDWIDNYLLGPEIADPATGLTGMDRLTAALAAHLETPAPAPNPLRWGLWAPFVAISRPGAAMTTIKRLFGKD